MAGVNDLIALGLGSWSTVSKLPTLGMGIGTTVGVGSITGYITIQPRLTGNLIIQPRLAGMMDIKPRTSGGARQRKL